MADKRFGETIQKACKDERFEFEHRFKDGKEYKSGMGVKGSSILDAHTIYGLSGTVVKVFDIKTGKAGYITKQILRTYNNLPAGYLYIFYEARAKDEGGVVRKDEKLKEK